MRMVVSLRGSFWKGKYSVTRKMQFWRAGKDFSSAILPVFGKALRKALGIGWTLEG